MLVSQDPGKAGSCGPLQTVFLQQDGAAKDVWSQIITAMNIQGFGAFMLPLSEKLVFLPRFDGTMKCQNV